MEKCQTTCVHYIVLPAPYYTLTWLAYREHLGGTVHKPNPVDENKYPILEARAAADYLVKQHEIPLANVLQEAFSMDTIGNVCCYEIC